MKTPRVCVVRTAGTNCDQETAFAFAQAGGAAELVHVNRLIGKKESLREYQVLAFPGGFTYGDDIAAGKILANELRYKLKDQLEKFVQDGKLIIGICNGFQILVKAGLLPGNENLTQEVTLTLNDSGKFEDRWVYVKAQGSRHKAQVECVWTKDLSDSVYLPVAHGEGKFIAPDKAVVSRLKHKGQIVLQYCDESGRLGGYPVNPNGSAENIAGICDESGRVLGLMPHPERHITRFHHPRWQMMEHKKEGDGLQIFKNGIAYARKYL